MKHARKTKHQVGKCPVCGRRVVLGRCRFKSGGIDKMDHCRQCCVAVQINGWKPKRIEGRARKTA